LKHRKRHWTNCHPLSSRRVNGLASARSGNSESVRAAEPPAPAPVGRAVGSAELIVPQRDRRR
jgi:hypothetical protein